MTDYDEGGHIEPAVGLFQNLSPDAIPVYTAKQVERGAAWIRDHYRDGTFRCPSGGTEGGGGCPDSPDE